MRRAIVLLVLALAAVLALVLVPALGAAPDGTAARARAFSGQFTSQITDEGKEQGQSATGVVARGTFSAKLSPAAAIVAHLVAAATGVPYPQLARGGSFVAKYSIDPSGSATGLFVAKFKSRGLGSECFSFKTKQGQYVPGSSFVPVSGSFKFTGGSGRAAHLRGSGKLDQTGISGTTEETISGKGSAAFSVAKKVKKPSPTCRSVR